MMTSKRQDRNVFCITWALPCSWALPDKEPQYVITLSQEHLLYVVHRNTKFWVLATGSSDPARGDAQQELTSRHQLGHHLLQTSIIQAPFMLLQGAVSAVPANQTAYSWRGALFDLQYYVYWDDPSNEGKLSFSIKFSCYLVEIDPYKISKI